MSSECTVSLVSENMTDRCAAGIGKTETRLGGSQDRAQADAGAGGQHPIRSAVACSTYTHPL